MAIGGIKVKAFADEYGMTSKQVLEILAKQGYGHIRTASNNIPPDDLPIIRSFFDEMKAEKAAPKATEKTAPKSVTKATPKATAKQPETAKPEPVKPAPAKPVPAKTEPARPEPVKPAPAKTEPVKPAPAKPVVKEVEKPEVKNAVAMVDQKEDWNETYGGHDDDNRSNRGGKNIANKNRDGEIQPTGNNNNKNNFKGGKQSKNPFKHEDRQNQNQQSQSPVQNGVAHITPPIVVKALAEAIGKRPNEVIMQLFSLNVLANINQTVTEEVATKVAAKFNVKLIVDKNEPKEEKVEKQAVDPENEEIIDDEKDLVPRPPIVTFMGHVDHGKTSLQDKIRKSHVAAGEAGGITQSIGASTVEIDGKTITFVDTPGHEAFTQMRARGANVTDLVVLVVAADDGFMPQTIEAMNHANAANVPIIVAMNKCDLPDADTGKILLHMQQHGLMSEDWGGKVAAIPVSAKTGMGIPDLLERILLEAEMLELKANPNRRGMAFVLESQLEQGFGATASVVVKNGSLKVGDPIICGEFCGKIRNLIDSHGKQVRIAGPSMPVKVVGLSGVPEAGTKMVVCHSMEEAKELAEKRAEEKRVSTLSTKTVGTSLNDLFAQIDEAKKKTLKVIVKADVRGSSEAIVESLKKLPSEKISVDILHVGVGAITESDVLLASSSDAIVVGFHVRVNPGVNELAKKENVEIRLYTIIYELLEDITDALAGRLEPEKREKDIGTIKILKIFNLSKGPKVCGCIVEKGIAKVGAKARVFRGSELIFNGEVRSLRRFQDDVKEVRQGMECGIRLDNFMDFTEGDIIQLYEIELKAASLV